MVSNRHTSSLVERKVARGGRLVPIGLFLTLFVYCAWQMHYALPASLITLFVYPGWLDGDASIGNGDPSTITAQIEEEDDNAITLHLNNLRHEFEVSCNHSDTLSMPFTNISSLLQERLTAFFIPPSTVEKLEDKDPVKPCRYTFIDLGANVGDSLGKFIDAGFPSECQGFGQIKKLPRYDIDQGTVALGKNLGNDLTNFAKRCLTHLSRHPEEYCYVGVEGNPIFTTRLQELEARVKGTKPKPIRSAHFYTETVGAGADGPTVLYLDTINAKHNFWGSSILATHQDAKKSAARNNNVAVKAPVMGLTLSTLLKRSVRQEPGAHVLIKLDIEGGEYPVMNEAIHTLCNYTSAGVRVDLILETHELKIVGEESPDMTLFFKETQQRLIACNIQQGDLSPHPGQR